MKAKIINFIKFIFVMTAIVLALGYCGQMDSEYQSARTQIVTEGRLSK